MKSTNPEILIFDLDGTLIDSSASILAGFDAALQAHKIEPKRALTEAIIGPPLRQTLSILSGSDDQVLLETLASAFKSYYDSEGYKATEAFAGIDSMLRAADSRKIRLHIATNKRLLPTRLILDHLGWSHLFASVYALDIYVPPFPDKTAMLAGLLKEQQVPVASAAYIGDRPEDGFAADANGLTFYAAQWGYSAFPLDDTSAHWITLATPEHIPCN